MKSKKLVMLFAAITALVSNAIVFTASAADKGDINYVALGDSIAAHYGLQTDEGYAELLAGKLQNEAGYKSVTLSNLAQSGDDTGDMLKKINDPANKVAISKADIITICIGANNFLKQVENVASLAVSSDQTQKSGGEIDISALSDDALSAAAKALSMPQAQTVFAQGIADFSSDMPKIISALKTLAPQAKIYWMTIYDPLADTSPLYSLVEGIFGQMNRMIATNAGLGYTSVDVYGAFNAYGADKALLTANALNPHPNKIGQRLIANVHYTAITGLVSSDVIDVRDTSADDIKAAIPAGSTALTRAEAVGYYMEGLEIKYGLNTDAIPLDGVAAFADVTADNKYYAQIMTAKALGIIGGVSSLRFNPDVIITRQDFACMLANANATLAKFGLANTLITGTGAYADSGSVSGYAKDAMLKCAASSMISVNGGKLDPFGKVTGDDILAALK